MKGPIFILFILSGFLGMSQRPVHQYVSFQPTDELPKGINSERAAVIFSVPTKDIDGFQQEEDVTQLIRQVHKALITMGIDPIFYLSDVNFTASFNARKSYVELFNQRRVKNIIFLTKSNGKYTIIMSPYNGSPRLIKDGSDAFFMDGADLYQLLLSIGKEVRRADQFKGNFLIPERPNMLNGVSTVENSLLKNYPGILRRSKLAVERFSPLDSTSVSDADALLQIKAYNREVKNKNVELEEIMKTYPYEYELIDPMSDDELKRKRYQFLLRSVVSSAATVKQMLGYDVLPSETVFASIIPVMPDQTRTKTIPREAIVCKFFIRQNISKNVHVGEWDADETWQEALKNMIGNLTQELRVKN